MSAANPQDKSLEDAFARVPREKFLGRGPWLIPDMANGHFQTPDDSLSFLYDNVLIAIDPSRGVNNGEPSFLARLVNAAAPAAGEHVVHIGAGVGYYTAIAERVSPEGRVTAIEFDPDLAARATENLSAWPQVEVLASDGTTHDTGPANAFLINAGTTGPLPLWLDNLKSDGRLILPMASSQPVFEHIPGLRPSAAALYAGHPSPFPLSRQIGFRPHGELTHLPESPLTKPKELG